MNRKVLGLAITALLAANAANAAEIYNKDGNKIELTGLVEAVYTFGGHGTPTFNGHNTPVNTWRGEDQSNDDGTIARIGFKGETQINSQLTGYAKFEHNFQANGQENRIDEEDGTRYAYVGLKYADYGSLDFGRNYGVVGIIRDFSDNAAKFGGDGFGGGTDVFMTGRTSSVITYSNKDFFNMVPGWNFYLQYQAENTAYADVNKEHGDGIAFTTTYEHAETGLGAGFTYANSDRTDGQVGFAGNNGENAEIWGIGAKYDANNIYLGATWAQTNNMIYVKDGVIDSNFPAFQSGAEIADKTRGFEIVAAYDFDFGLRPSIVYNQQRGRNLTGFQVDPVTNPDGISNAYLVKYIGLGASYTFNKNMDMAVGYKINLLDEENEYVQRHQLDAGDAVEMRLTYSF